MTSFYRSLKKVIRVFTSKKKKTLCYQLKIADFGRNTVQNDLSKEFFYKYHHGELILEMIYVFNHSNEFGYWDPEKVKTQIIDRLISNGSIVVFSNTEPIAVSSLCFLANTDLYPTLMYLVVVDKFRGKGIGNFLMLEMIKLTKENGYEGIKLKTDTNRPEAVRLYEKFGFKRMDCGR